MTAPALLLAHSWKPEIDPTDWWLSEKLDGVRAYWDGKQLISRLGNPFYAPDWFIEKFPQMHLDGELWVGRKKFQDTVSIVRRQDKNDEWKKVKYIVFDAPRIKDAPFEDRMAILRECVDEICPAHVKVVNFKRCRGFDHLKTELKKIEKRGGEGLMMREPESLYETKRSHTLLKVKSFYDSEAKVVGHSPGKGKHKGRLGALEVTLLNGTQFSIGTGLTDQDRDNPPPIGSIVTYRYQELTNAGVPRFPAYYGVRDDISW